MKRIDDHCSLLAFKFPAVITGRVDATIVSLVYVHCNFRFLSRHLLSGKIPNDGAEDWQSSRWSLTAQKSVIFVQIYDWHYG